jgi:hypothetical protein
MRRARETEPYRVRSGRGAAQLPNANRGNESRLGWSQNCGPQVRVHINSPEALRRVHSKVR